MQRNPIDGTITADRPTPGQQRAGTYVGDSYEGDIAMTMHGTPALAADGELAGLARVTMAMRPAARMPKMRHLAGLSLWAAALGVFGFVLAIRAAIGMMVGAPDWFGPTFILLGVVGVIFTMSAFLAARMRRVPWVALGMASCALIGAVAATLAAF